MNKYVPLSICLSILVITGALILIYHLNSYKNKHPYKNISSFWIIATLISIIIQQICSTFIFTLINSPYLQVIHSIIINNVRMICLIMRSISIYHTISYTNHHLSRRFFHDSFHIENDRDFTLIFYNRRFKYIKLFYILISGLVIAGLICTFIKDRIICYFDLLFNSKQETSDFSLGFVALNTIFYALLFIYFYYTISLFKYSLKKDLFKVKYELVGSFIITYLGYNIQDIAFLILKYKVFKMNKFTQFVFDMIINIGIIILIGVLTILRYLKFKIFSIAHLKDFFFVFLENDIPLKLFKDYIKMNQEDYYKYLNFWVDYYRYISVVRDDMQRIKNIKKAPYTFFNSRKLSDEVSLSSQDKHIVNEIEKQLQKLAKVLYKDYFFMSNVSGDTPSNWLTIEFPTDIFEKIDEQYQRNFLEGHFDEIFQEAFTWVYGKLETIYVTFVTDHNEKDKLEKILFYVYCFEISSFDQAIITSNSN